MPSLLHLSSTENELTNANVCGAEFNNGLSVQESADVLINNDNDDLTAKPMHYLCSRCKGCLIFMGV